MFERMKITIGMRKIWFVLDFAQSNNELPPTLRELQDICGYKSTAPVRYHLKQLQRIGVIAIDFNIARGITLKEPYNWFDGD